jgi:hypothetical protein
VPPVGGHLDHDLVSEFNGPTIEKGVTSRFNTQGEPLTT